MARDCPFLKWDNSIGFLGGLRCIASQERVETGSALYNTYCHNYESGYSKCPHFKGDSGSSSGGCYLTSACVEAMGLADNCLELTTLRSFRDGWLAKQDGGKALIDEYYRIAPKIVDAIHAEPNSDEILRKLYGEMVVPCVEDIEAGDMGKARMRYENWTNRLKLHWLGDAEA